MTSIIIAGSPDMVAAEISAIIALGNNIYVVKKTKGNSEYIVVYGV